jgi:adenylate cyclase
MERKLTTVFHADVAGYSGLMGQDEAGTLRTLQTYRAIMDAQLSSIAGVLWGLQAKASWPSFPVWWRPCRVRWRSSRN